MAKGPGIRRKKSIPWLLREARKLGKELARLRRHRDVSRCKR